MNQLEFCRIECERQGTDKKVEMALALSRAKMLRSSIPNIAAIRMLGRMIEPEIIAHGFRGTPVTFANGSLAVNAEHIPRLLQQLLDNWNNLTAQEIFQEFERIHPFADGNGRLGQILFNWKNGTLHDPVFSEEYVDTART